MKIPAIELILIFIYLIFMTYILTRIFDWIKSLIKKIITRIRVEYILALQELAIREADREK